MDLDYLKNMAGSPYVNEGVIDRMKSQAAKGIQAGAAMLGHQLEDPRTTRVKSLWESCSGKLYHILTDVQENIIPLIRHSAKRPTHQQEELMNKLTELYHTIVPPKAVASSLYGALKETLGDVFTRDITLNKVLASNDANKILNAYKDRVVKIYDGFLNDVSKVLSIPRNVVEGAVLRFLPSSSPKNTINSIKELQTISPLNSQLSQPTTPTPSSIGGAGGNPPTQNGGGGAEGAPVPSGNADKNSLGEIVEQVVKIIIDAVSSDVRSKKWMTIPQLPTDWGKIPVTKWEDPQDAGKELQKEAEEQDTKTNDGNEEETDGVASDVESPGEFLYNFHSRQKKFPDSFTIEVTPSNKSLETLTLSNGKVKKLLVVWSVRNKTENNIYVKHKTISDSSTSQVTESEEEDTSDMETTHLFKFWDHQANPRTPNNNFNIDVLIAQAHPSKKDLLKDIDPKIREQIDSLTPTLLRACYATTSRKHMEFSPKGLNIRLSTKGTVLLIKRDGNHDEVSEDTIEVLLQSESYNERKKWLDGLTKIGWFEFVGEKKKVAYETPKSAENPIKLVPIDNVPMTQNEKDAVAALSHVSPWNKDIPTVEKYVKMAFDELGADATAEHLANGALQKMKYAMKGNAPSTSIPNPEEPKPEVSKPASEPEKKTVVSKEPSAPAGGEPPSSPVSNADKEKVATNPKKTEPNVGSVKFDDKGNVEWTKPDGTIRKFTAKQINNIASPRLKQSLKKSGYPFEKHGISNLNETKSGLINPFRVENLL